MSSWSCDNYLSEFKQIGLDQELSKVLDWRPHQQWNQAHPDDLVTIPDKFLPMERKQKPHFYVRVHKNVYPSLIQLLIAAKKDGIELTVQSGFRSLNTQNYLWQTALKKSQYDFKTVAYRIAPPCFSEHATGRAVDFATKTVNEKIADSEAYPWLQKNAEKFGWKQSFKSSDKNTSEDPSARGIMIEEWHWSSLVNSR